MRTRWMAVAAALLTVAGAQGVTAQAGDRPAMRRGGEGMGMGMEARGRAAGAAGAALDIRIGQLLDRRHTLGLSDAQVTSLQALQADARARLQPMRDEMTAVRQGLRDGTLTRSEARERMQTARQGWDEQRQTLADRLDQTLEPRQRALLRGAALLQGRDQARPGRGAVRPSRGDVRQRRGQPGTGPNGLRPGGRRPGG